MTFEKVPLNRTYPYQSNASSPVQKIQVFNLNMAYHSTIASDQAKLIGNVPILPLKILSNWGGTRGPAPQARNGDRDIVDEALDLFKTNVFFSNFEIVEKADLILVYSILYISTCLKKLTKCGSKDKAIANLRAQALVRFSMPGDSDFPLNAYFQKAKNANESEELKQYLTQLRQELGFRLIERAFDPKLSGDGKPSKWWICFSKRRFLKTELTEEMNYI